jgi:hypothetical protein
MSKIPQGEWNAIAARYARGEPISRIAQSYSCTPPAIHYILKRNKQQTAQTNEQPSVSGLGSVSGPAHVGLGALTAGAPFRPTETRREPSNERASLDQTNQLAASPDRRLAIPVRPAQSKQRPAPSPQVQPDNPQKGRRASAFTAGLDQELHGRAEAAIEAFRSSFDAALTEGSPSVRQQLREAASDLMRVAARTTIVLDRLNARAEPFSIRMPDHLRPAQTSEYR